jgi:two-component system, NarL family, invasion response regulator UvrY
MSMIKILIADDHAVVRRGIKQMLADEADLAVRGEATTGSEVLQRLREQAFDLIILDMSMPGRSGIELIKQIKAERPRFPILVFSMHEESQYAVRSLKAGASGYLSKNSDPKELIAAIRRLAAGGIYVTSAVAEKLAQESIVPQTTLPHERLSDREYQIFERLVAGHTVTAIATELCLSVKTVSTHKCHLLDKMGLSNAIELTRYALEQELVNLHDCLEY